MILKRDPDISVPAHRDLPRNSPRDIRGQRGDTRIAVMPHYPELLRSVPHEQIAPAGGKNAGERLRPLVERDFPERPIRGNPCLRAVSVRFFQRKRAERAVLPIDADGQRPRLFVVPRKKIRQDLTAAEVDAVPAVGVGDLRTVFFFPPAAAPCQEKQQDR